jgi:hypothetical protein
MGQSDLIFLCEAPDRVPNLGSQVFIGSADSGGEWLAHRALAEVWRRDSLRARRRRGLIISEDGFWAFGLFWKVLLFGFVRACVWVREGWWMQWWQKMLLPKVCCALRLVRFEVSGEGI